MAGYIEDRWLNKRPDPETGKRKRTARYGKGDRYKVAGIPGVRSRTFETLADAKTWKAKAEHEARKGDFVDPRRGAITLKEYVEQHWWPTRIVAHSSRGPMRSRIWNHVIPQIGSQPLRAINADTLRTWKAGLLTRVEGSTAEVIWGHLSSILESAVEDERIPKNPCRAHRSIKPPKNTTSKAVPWDRGRVDAVRDAVQERYRVAIDLGVGLGLRQGEVFGLGTEDINVTAGIVHVRRQLRWNDKGRPYFSLPKGAKTREVPAPPLLLNRIAQALEKFPAVHCTLPWLNPEAPTTDLEERQRRPVTVPLLLTTTQGNRIYYRTWNERTWHPALAAAGILKILRHKEQSHGGRIRRYPVYDTSRADGFHVLRHTFASTLLEAGENVVTVSKWLGHASPEITLRHYAHFMPEAGSRGLKVMNGWFETPRPSILPRYSPEPPPKITWKAYEQVKPGTNATASVNVKYKETARGGLAVNIIEC
ncbi:tyrosine-type recombinase/integrase [Streptomyces fractus]|uniref:tyrosine-type recombinase/integrase n=1 Tax=Streptomyces fractus TaxID=641806 RepID=UPI003CE8A974